ncbi:MAG: hypothetical protein NVS4B8_13980 [Herpetosiphon sp.]
MAQIFTTDHAAPASSLGDQGVAAPAEHSAHPQTSLGLNTRKLGLWTFISSEALFFTALVAAYLVLKERNRVLGGPLPRDFLGIQLTALLAFILLASSLTMVLALAATERNDQRGIKRWLSATMLLGLMFLGGQTYEFRKLWSEHFVTITVTKADGEQIREGVRAEEADQAVSALQQRYPDASVSAGDAKPVTWTTSVFGSSFFTLTGFHGTHVGIGVIWLGIVLVMTMRGAIGPKNSLTVEMAGLYWHFVDLVWVAIFTLIYLI